MAALQSNKIISIVAVVASMALVVRCQDSGSRLASIPGAKTATGIMASSVDGLSRYFAPDGPIQPALTAIGGLPMRGAELANKGITRISSGLDSGARSLSRSAGNDGTIRMPGMDTMESAMPASVAQLGSAMQGAIRSKNNFIRGQAERGVQAGERLRSMMQNGLQGMAVRSSGHMVGAANMLSSAQDTLMKSGSQIQSQLKQSLDGTMGRLSSMQGIGENVRNQAQGITRTLSNGLTGTIDHLQRTNEQLKSQIQGGLQQNTAAMGGILESMQGSMGNMGQNLQKNLEGAMRQAQSAAQQVTNSLQQAASGPLNMIQGLGSNLMQAKGSLGGGQSSGGRY